MCFLSLDCNWMAFHLIRYIFIDVHLRCPLRDAIAIWLPSFTLSLFLTVGYNISPSFHLYTAKKTQHNGWASRELHIHHSQAIICINHYIGAVHFPTMCTKFNAGRRNTWEAALFHGLLLAFRSRIEGNITGLLCCMWVRDTFGFTAVWLSMIQLHSNHRNCILMPGLRGSSKLSGCHLPTQGSHIKDFL